jgi:phosphatidylserine decarboxylase
VTAAAGAASEKAVPVWARAPLWKAYSAAVGADPSEAAAPLDSFETFDAFFTRELRPGLRPIDRDAALVCPADGRLDQIGRITGGRCVQAKGIHYATTELIGDVTEAARFEGGLFATIYLSPADYHRVHCPVDLAVSRIRHLGGDLWPVNGLSVPRVPGLFVQNERVVFTGTTPTDTLCSVVMVGAIVVGRISVAHPDFSLDAREPGEVRTLAPEGGWARDRGSELGAFRLGSTAVVLIEDRDQSLRPACEAGQRVRLGQPLFVR